MSEYLIPHSKVRCIDCRGSHVSIEGYQQNDTVTLKCVCDECDNRWGLEVDIDE
jgi:hypothetical protein